MFCRPIRRNCRKEFLDEDIATDLVKSENRIRVKRSGKPAKCRLGLVACGNDAEHTGPVSFVLISVAGWMNRH
jgi:hypothetical protein